MLSGTNNPPSLVNPFKIASEAVAVSSHYFLYCGIPNSYFLPFLLLNIRVSVGFDYHMLFLSTTDFHELYPIQLQMSA